MRIGYYLTNRKEKRMEARFVFTCEECKNYKYGSCSLGFELIEEHEDAYDCPYFEDVNPV